MSFNKLYLAPLSLLALACSSQAEPKSIAAGASCGKLTGAQETLASIYEPGGVYQAKPIKQKIFRARASQREMIMGASLYVRAESDMSAPYIRRVLSCHADQAIVAHANDPLHPASGTVTELSVESSKFGYRIDVRGDKPSVGREIWSRADALGNRSNSVKVEQVAADSKHSDTL